jgi:hypothetical protein
MQLLPGGAAELPPLSNPHSRPVVEWGTIPSQRVQYEDFVIVPEKSKIRMFLLACSHERFGLQAIGMGCLNRVQSTVVYLEVGVSHETAYPVHPS